MKNKYFYSLSIGEIGIAEEDGSITDIFFRNLKKIEGNIKETAIIKIARKQLEEYLNGKRKSFDLKIKPQGSEFQTKVWNELLKIDYGTCVSYGYIAEKIGNPKAARAVGMANNKNPILIVIPCHRVIASDRKLRCYAAGLSLKKELIELEYNNRNC